MYRFIDPAKKIEILEDRLKNYELNHFVAATAAAENTILENPIETQASEERRDSFKKLIDFLCSEIDSLRAP